MHDQDDPALAFAEHDHSSCSGDVMKRAEALAEAKALRLTPVRRRTLEILLESHQALGAYDVLARLSEEGFGTQPPVAYRALEFLVDHGLAHRIRRLNAFAACMHPGEPHSPVFLICDQCDNVAEAPGRGVRDALDAAAERLDFQIARTNIEAVGLCATCRKNT